MRVLQIHNSYLHRGGEDVVVDIEKDLLLRHGIEVEQLIFTNDQLSLVNLYHNKEAAAKLRTKIASFQPQVIHVHNLFYQASPSVLYEAKRHHIPVVMTLHNFRLVCPNAMFMRNNGVCTQCLDRKLAIPAIRYGCFQDSGLKSAALASALFYHNLKGSWRKNVDKFLVLTPFIKKLILSSSLNLGDDQVDVKPNSTDDLAPVIPCQDRNGPYVSIGRLSKEKGLNTLIEAFNRLPELKLSIIGDGPQMEKLRKLAGPNIRFVGSKDRPYVQRAIKRAPALIFTSVIYEGLPNGIIESFSAGTPVIASNVDNINQIVKQGHNGLLFESKNTDELVETIRHFDEDRDIKFYRGARDTFEQKYTHGHNYGALMSVYRSVVNSYEKENT